MDAMYVYLIASSGFFLLGWVVLLLVAYAKNEKDDLSAAERLAMAKAVASMLSNYRRRK